MLGATNHRTTEPQPPSHIYNYTSTHILNIHTHTQHQQPSTTINQHNLQEQQDLMAQELLQARAAVEELEALLRQSQGAAAAGAAAGEAAEGRVLQVGAGLDAAGFC